MRLYTGTVRESELKVDSARKILYSSGNSSYPSSALISPGFSVRRSTIWTVWAPFSFILIVGKPLGQSPKRKRRQGQCWPAMVYAHMVWLVSFYFAKSKPVTNIWSVNTGSVCIHTASIPARSLPLKSRERSARDVFDTFALYAHLVYDVTDWVCWAQNDCSYGRVFATFKYRFLTNWTTNWVKNDMLCACVGLPFRSIVPAMLLQFDPPLSANARSTIIGYIRPKHSI